MESFLGQTLGGCNKKTACGRDHIENNTYLCRKSVVVVTTPRVAKDSLLWSRLWSRPRYIVATEQVLWSQPHRTFLLLGILWSRPH